MISDLKEPDLTPFVNLYNSEPSGSHAKAWAEWEVHHSVTAPYRFTLFSFFLKLTEEIVKQASETKNSQVLDCRTYSLVVASPYTSTNTPL